jgi:hypothetical protein
MMPKLLLDENLRSDPLWNAIQREKGARTIDIFSFTPTTSISPSSRYCLPSSVC